MYLSFSAAAEVSKDRGRLSESQRKAKRRSNNSQASQKMLQLSYPAKRFDSEKANESFHVALLHFIKMLRLVYKQRNTKKPWGAVKACEAIVPSGGCFWDFSYHFSEKKKTLRLYVWYAVLAVKDQRRGWPAKLVKWLQTQNIQHRTLKSCPCVGGRLNQ